MKIPALRSKIGDWTYYVTTLTFEQVSQNISKVDDHLHKSESLKELIQRSVTSNYLSIKEYIVKQPELFFNALVLAVYDNYPDWSEIEVTYDNGETYQLGLLDFPSNHKIFPLDGQHRVEGIRAALAENPSLGNQQIAAIFVGHKNDEAGMQRSRRLFSTLNRYAKPVTMDDIIALDEDDSIAIVTRELLENFNLFTNKRVTKNKNKAIHDSDKVSFTSIITLYDCNYELLKLFRRKRRNEHPNAERDNKTLKEYLKFRPIDDELNLFNEFCFNFWSVFSAEFTVIGDYLSNETIAPATIFRNSENGGNLLFRPVGLLPMVQAAIEIHKREKVSFQEIFRKLNEINLTLNISPWPQVIWNNYEHTMIMNNQGLTKLFLIYLYSPTLIRSFELATIKLKYAAAIAYQGDIDDVLNDI
ncbi:DGQHR domain-containing protein [Flavihumibacter sp. R14]|nr:DGQHR domain-containing protein [Flavihumibacter soli]